jgi:hypothetical protein
MDEKSGGLFWIYCNNELSNSMRRREFLNELSDNKLLKKDSTR